ncbi:Six-hairpin glycosidase [Delitschia confertaspora ATCC 74209]|uniref:Six-hairpin glycosidase n=1 Tax=Delitschia confertaspora ATCC 74209 TaxID=1513339 RepID=A0A9P4JI69_9PLEO|nr:Six-hairpin glycosidase [Delitschia confertaspora ATCC 74209]
MLTTALKLGIADRNYEKAASDVAKTTYSKAPRQNKGGWLNEYYDDEGWWALCWIAAYDLTDNTDYLETARSIFDDMVNAWSTPCDGGVWWDKSKTQIAAISNELFLSVAAHLASRVERSNTGDYISWAEKEWDYFSKSGIINGKGTVNDGIDIKTCKNNNAAVLTYNQGVILGGLAELAHATGDFAYLDSAHDIANAALLALTDNGILTETGGIEEDTTLAMFKGIFVRGLRRLYEESPRDVYRDFLRGNADSVWGNDRDGNGFMGPRWQGPLGMVTSASHASAVDALVAAVGI